MNPRPSHPRKYSFFQFQKFRENFDFLKLISYTCFKHYLSLPIIQSIKRALRVPTSVPRITQHKPETTIQNTTTLVPISGFLWKISFSLFFLGVPVHLMVNLKSLIFISIYRSKFMLIPILIIAKETRNWTFGPQKIQSRKLTSSMVTIAKRTSGCCWTFLRPPKLPWVPLLFLLPCQSIQT